MRARMILLGTILVLLWAELALAQGAPDAQITKGPQVVSVTNDSATITWSTNEPTSAIVRYGTDRNNLNNTAQQPWGGTDHSVQLRGLKPGATYYYEVISAQGQRSGTGAVSAIQQFTTKGEAAAARPQQAQPAQAANQEADVKMIAGPIPQKVTDKSAEVWWETNKQSSTIVRYGTDRNNLNQTAQEPWGQQAHKVKLDNLQAGTQYFVSVQTSSGRELGSAGFKTENGAAAQQQFQMIHGPVIELLGDTSAVIAWTTNRPASSIVRYGTDPNNLDQQAEAPWGQQTHRVTVRNLKPSTKYWFQVESGQARGSGQMAKSAPFPAETMAPGQQAMRFETRY